MNDALINGVLLSDFNIEPLHGYLENNEEAPSIISTVAPFGQVIHMLLDTDNEIWSEYHDFALVWTRPESVLNSFSRALDFHCVQIEDIFAEIDNFVSALEHIRPKVKTILVPTWVIPTSWHGYGMIDMKKGVGIVNTLMQMNLYLAEKIDNLQNTFLLNSERWVRVAGEGAFNPKLWYLGKIAFGNKVFKEACRDINSALQGIRGDTKKIIIVDLDETLWGGIVGDTGWENLRLGGHDPIGEAYVDFQKALQSFTNRGVLLGIVSKNEESVALEAIEKNPEMVLKIDDFSSWKINWDDKARNIVELMDDLNLGLQSAVFIDDNPMERARVAEALPEVQVPEWPEDKMLYRQTLLSLNCFDTPMISDEDRSRMKMYQAERERDKTKTSISSPDEWIKTLEVKVLVENLDSTNIKRSVQLLNKTNQMNLSTRRMTESELLDWIKGEGRCLWTFRVSDKFGDYGLTGITSMERDGQVGKVIDFILSCRVMGRNIEEVMLSVMTTYARSLRLSRIEAKFLSTSKNKPCHDFFMRSVFSTDKAKVMFRLDLDDEYPKPDYIKIIE